MIHPLGRMACVCILAALVSQVVSFHPGYLLAGVSVWALGWWRHVGPLRLVGWGLLFLTWMLFQQRPPVGGLAAHGIELPARMDVWVEIAGDPQITAFSHDGDEEYRFPVGLGKVHYFERPTRVKERAQLRLDQMERLEEMVPGSRWKVKAVVREGRSGWAALWKSDVRIDALEAPQAAGSGVSSVLYRKRMDLVERLYEVETLAPDTSAVLQGLLLGRRSDLSDEWNDRFARTGLIHVFAISGLHVGMLGGMLVLILRLAGVPMTRWVWWVAPVVLLFVIVTGARASAIRAGIMVLCFLSAPACLRKPNATTALSFSAMFILLIAPWQVLEIGFIYSFVLVAGLLVFVRPVQSWFDRLLEPDPWAPPSLRRQWVRKVLWNPFCGLISVSLVAFALSSPLTAYWFHQFSPVAVLGNVLVIPIVFVLLLTGLPAVLIASVAPGLVPDAVWWPAAICGDGLLGLALWMESFPLGQQAVRGPSLWQILALYSGVAVWVMFPRWRRGVVALWLVAGAVSVVMAYHSWREPELMVVDGGRGQVSWLQEGNEILLFDLGDRWTSWSLRQSLKSRGVDRVDVLFCTHADRNHLGNLKALTEQLPVGHVVLPTQEVAHPAFGDLVEVCTSLGIPLSRWEAGDSLRWKRWAVECLSPSMPFVSRAADTRGLVLKVSAGFHSFLLMGGSDRRVERQLLNRGEDLGSRVLLAGHPAGQSSCDADFLTAVAPAVVVFSGRSYQAVSENRAEAEARVLQQSIPLWRVPEDGWLRFGMQSETIHISR